MPNKLLLQIEGHLGKSPEFLQPEGKKPYYRFSVGVNTGTKEAPKTVWVTVYDRSKPEWSQSPYLKKGDAVFVEGEPWANGWQAKDGNNRADLCVTTFKVLKIDWHKGGEAKPVIGEDSQIVAQGDQYQSDLPF
jgi:single-stranded DNA-binding protein